MMEIKIHEQDGIKIAEVAANKVLISNAEEGLQLLADLYYQDFDRIILHERNICNDFFDLRTKLAGEILQKFSNFRVRLAIVGDFNKFSGQSIKDFIFESNKSKQINFLTSLADAKDRLSAQ